MAFHGTLSGGKLVLPIEVESIHVSRFPSTHPQCSTCAAVLFIWISWLPIENKKVALFGRYKHSWIIHCASNIIWTIFYWKLSFDFGLITDICGKCTILSPGHFWLINYRNKFASEQRNMFKENEIVQRNH